MLKLLKSRSVVLHFPAFIPALSLAARFKFHGLRLVCGAFPLYFLLFKFLYFLRESLCFQAFHQLYPAEFPAFYSYYFPANGSLNDGGKKKKA